ncbi:MAG: hypothetical protein EAX86_09005 [Candidatus Heimdallarchaeota archaeon]|nr:hypothetical protein [Candidatus Heimdallarchaeota archaeon]
MIEYLYSEKKEFQEYPVEKERYFFYAYKSTILEYPSKTLYKVQYDSYTNNHLKSFPEFEESIKRELKSYILRKYDYCKFDELLRYLYQVSDIETGVPSQLLLPLFFRILNMENIGKLLADDQIDEIYIDSSQKSIYIDHMRHGRCYTDIVLSSEEIDSFIQRIALENDFSLNRLNPTMKCEFFSQIFQTRVTVDIPPLTIKDIHIDIRKFRFQNLRIIDLIRNNTILYEQALFLLFLIRSQVSITILGPPNSGKTTLQNALMEYIPEHLRLLSIEDVLETHSLREGNAVHFRLGYDPQEALILSKSLEVQKILHRSPDFINLGELSMKSHFNAYLNVLSIGVPSIQTIHGKNYKKLIKRLQDIYNVPIELITSSIPHIFVELGVTWINNRKNRSVISIAELTEEGTILQITNETIKDFLFKSDDPPKIQTINHLITHKIITLDTIFSEITYIESTL